MTRLAHVYQWVLTLALLVLCLVAPRPVQGLLSHAMASPFPDRAEHAARHNTIFAHRGHQLTSNPNPTQRVGARDEGKAAAERRWDGAPPYDWDGRDKLRTIRKPDGTRLDYSYDVFGRRVSKTRSGGPLDDKRVEFVWDGEVLAFELDTETGPRAFVHEPGGFEPILQQQGGETYLCVNDHLGMPKELIDGEGNLAWAAAHSAYGGVIAKRGPDDVEVEGGFVQSDGPRVESPFRLLGQVNDEDAELAWTRFRCFDAETGTWISTDPLGLVGGTQTYGFDGSPADVVDPFGLSTSGGSPCVKVLGRLEDTAVAKGWEGHEVLDDPNWSIGKNDAWVQSGIDSKQTFYLASPTDGNMIQKEGNFAGQPTVYARELDQLDKAGYERIGDNMVHPDNVAGVSR